MKIFITGATGWVGSHVTPLLLKAGHQITAIARSDASATKVEEQGVKVVRATLEDTDLLTKAAGEADAVIHLAYIHDFSDYGGRPAQIDYAAIRAMASALEGTYKPLIITSGTTVAPTINELTETDVGVSGPRAEAENVAFAFAGKGVRVIAIRLPFSVHGDGDFGLIPHAVAMARKTGVAAYIGDGLNKWPAVHVDDAAELYKLAVEGELPGGTVLHAIGDTGVPFKDISAVIAKKTGAEVKGVSKEEAGKYLGFLAGFGGMGGEPKSQLTRQWTGWSPKGKGILEDLETSETYFAVGV
ncbi:hypothetical protein IAT38_001693 [Cryptococcus sp. DSM 104549]